MSTCQSSGVIIISSSCGHDVKVPIIIILKFWGMGVQDVDEGFNNSPTYGLYCLERLSFPMCVFSRLCLQYNIAPATATVTGRPVTTR